MTNAEALKDMTEADERLAHTLYAIERFGHHTMTSGYAPQIYHILAGHLRNPANRAALVSLLNHTEDQLTLDLVVHGATLK